MNAPKVQFLFDFGSPNAYLCHQVIPAIAARTGAVFEPVPILLGGLFKLANNRSPMEAYAHIPNKLAYEQLELKRFVARHGLRKFRFNPHFPVNTLKVMRGACAAQRLGCLTPYMNVVFQALWEDGQNMDDGPTITATLQAGGLDAQALLALSQDPEVKAQLLANTQQAHEQGAFGSPSFLIGQDLWFGKERLRDVEEAILTAAG
jgi:2-hydroxychromene-2-carboxylate isomerase